MRLSKLDNWYSIKEYDPEGKESGKILEIGKLTGKRALIVGTYGLLSVSAKVSAYAKSVVGVHPDKGVIDYCKKKYKNIDFKAGNITKLKFKDNEFDIIISPWAGLHYLKNNIAVIKELKRVLKDRGILLIEEADETSEYFRILEFMDPSRQVKAREKRDKLQSALNKYFKVKEFKLRTFYYFKSASQFKGYFEKEIRLDEKKKFTKIMDEKLDEIIRKKRNLAVEEKSVFFKCTKS